MSYANHADLGGQTGSGRVEPKAEDGLFHAHWEARAMALTVAMGATGAWNIDMSRSARETLPDYARLSYYQIWLAGLQRLLADQGLATDDELAAGRALHAPRPLPRVLRAADVPAALAKGSPTLRRLETTPRFAVGERVRTRGAVVPHHSRLPAYAMGKLGVIEAVRGAHVFADANAQGLGEAPQWLYSVVFGGRTLWGDEASPNLKVTIDAWESYLQAA